MAAKPKTMAGFGDPLLPPEICREILVRLPVKSVLRCRSVCKSWHSLISCPNFISQHSITNLHNNNGNRFVLHHPDSSFTSHDMDIESREHDYDCSLDRFIGREITVVGSCNGLVCLFERSSRDGVWTVNFLIWNPAIRKIVELPPISYRFDTQYAFPLVGFGFDSSTGDYKVLCTLCRYIVLENNIHRNVCQIFDLSKGVWRRISSVLPFPRVFIHREPECYFNGAVHWSVFRYQRGMGRSILSFNMSDESFGEIRMPDYAEFTQSGDDNRHIRTRCVTFGGLVHVIVWKEWGDDEDEVPASCSVWTMKEYGVTESWIKVSYINLPSVQVLLRAELHPENFILWAKHEILVLHHPPLDDDEKQDLVLYNTKRKKSKRLFSVNKYARNTPLWKQLCLYKESLVLM